MLEAAHQGYAYQDLLVAIRLTDLLLGEVVTAIVDKKLFNNDLFDDLTTVGLNGNRERVQIKNTGNAKPLAISNFTTNQRNLKLDSLIASAVEDRHEPGAQAKLNEYRILLRDARPNDPRLIRVLQVPRNDPGPFVAGMSTVRYRFDSEVLWPTRTLDDPGDKAASETFAFLQNGHLGRSDLVWFCDHVIVEVEAPSATFDLTNPGPAERLLIDRVQRDIGAGTYPNSDRSPIDVAAALIRTVIAVRAGRATVTANELLRRAQLRHDFGAVARAHPIDATVEVARPTTTNDITQKAGIAADQAVPLIVVGPPGQGKSWACQRVQDLLRASGWLVAEHYCFLGDADEERHARVHADRVIGSLLGRLADAEPNIVGAQRPKFAADDRTLVEAVTCARNLEPTRRVALVVDGLDHVTRVLGSTSGQTHPSEMLAERLAGLGLPKGAVVVIFSQPGTHLRPLSAAGALVMDMPGLERTQLQQLAHRWHIIELPAFCKSSGGDSPTKGTTDGKKEEEVNRFLDALFSRSAGNALYATYLCREVLRAPTTSIDPVETLQSLPPFDGSLSGYYQHLCKSLGDGAWVADIVALLDFAVSRTELREMRPDIAHRIDPALEHLEPVLVKCAMQGGIRVYHESFARFWLEKMANDESATVARLIQVAKWLETKGLFKDSRAYRFLLPTLARAKNFQEVLTLIGPDFVSKSIVAGFQASAIKANLGTAATCAAIVNHWPVVVRCIELSRAADTFEYERLDSTLVEFSDVVMALLGSQTFASRLLYDGRITVPARAGIKLCAEIDRSGAVAPWPEYLEAFESEKKDDNTSYGEESNRQIALAVLRGKLRVATSTSKFDRHRISTVLDLHRLALDLDQAELPTLAVIDLVCDTLGLTKAMELLSKLTKRGAYALAIAEKLAASEDPSERGQFFGYATLAVNDESCEGETYRLLNLGVPIDSFEPKAIETARIRLLDLTLNVQGHSVQFETTPVFQWLDACAIAARRDPFGLATAEALLVGDGWYRCWLRFVVELCRAEAEVAAQRSPKALDALRLLTDDLRPFKGDPRACDLYRLQGVITSTLRRAIGLLSNEMWAEGTQILIQVCDGVSTTLSGEMGGPLARDTLLDLVVAGSNSNRYSTSFAILSKALNEDVDRRFYADIAGFHLAAARLAIKSDQQGIAAQHWHLACKFLVSYGYRKDTTIYELLDPLEVLIPIDQNAAQERLEVLQPLCERVLFHTDLKGTRHTRSHWWTLIAAADPFALAVLIAPKLLSECNMPDDELEKARVALWRAQNRLANPFVSGALRLSIQRCLDSDDAQALERLSKSVTGTRDVSFNLLQLLIARADERPTRYPYDNDADQLKADEERVAEINEVALRLGIPAVLPSSIQNHEDKSHFRPLMHHPDLSLSDFLEENYLSHLDMGLRGLAKAISVWHNRPYGTVEERWSPARFANVIGYRLLELLEQGKTAEVDLAIRNIAEGMHFSYDYPLLGEIAEGLDRHNYLQQAALAYTLNWTRSRGKGGWLNFGGETNIVSLQRAAKIDARTTLDILATEVERIFSGRYGTLGVSQALILALSTVDWGSNTHWPAGQSSIQIAFSAWDEAATVIGERLPRVGSSDDPDLPYVRGNLPVISSNPIDTAFIVATIAGVGHPSREQKRRSLVAMQLLAQRCPTATAEALDLVFANLSEPGTLSWFLAVLDEVGPNKLTLITRCSTSLKRLCNSPYLTVRALSRQLLATVETVGEALPSFDPIPELIDQPSPSILVQEPNIVNSTETSIANETSNDENIRAKSILNDTARVRITHAEKSLPCFGSSVTAELVRILETEHYKHRFRKQLEWLSSQADCRFPDAFIAPYETAEEVLQRVAGAGRVALALAGNIISNPIDWELNLARILLNDPRVPLAFEAIRVPRPDLPPPPGHGDTIWQKIISSASNEGKKDTMKLPAAIHDRDYIAATTALKAPTTVPTILEGPYKGWKTIACQEIRISRPQRSASDKGTVTVISWAAIEFRQNHDEAGLKMPPIGNGPLEVWFLTFPLDMPVLSLGHTAPLIVTDDDNAITVDGTGGLGYSCMPLAPSYLLLQKLGLRPGNGLFELVDENGNVGLTARNWRTNYVVSDYEMGWPTLRGTALLARPDVFNRIVTEFGSNLTWREYISGSEKLLAPEAGA